MLLCTVAAIETQRGCGLRGSGRRLPAAIALGEVPNGEGRGLVTRFRSQEATYRQWAKEGHDDN